MRKRNLKCKRENRFISHIILTIPQVGGVIKETKFWH